MADLSITAANVAPYSSGYTQVGIKTAGESITAGQPVYLKASDGKVYKADCNVAAANAVAVGIAMNSASTGQQVIIGKGNITIGATVAAAKVYVLSENAGGICEYGGTTTTGDYMSVLGYAINTTVINFILLNTGIQHA